MLLNPLQARRALSHARKNNYAILAVNADSPAAIVDCFEAARLASAPLIIETSLWQLKGHSFGLGKPERGLLSYLSFIATLCEDEDYLHLPVIFHTDHIKGDVTIPLLCRAIEGFWLKHSRVPLSPSTISLDSSELTDDQNISKIKSLCQFAEETERPLTLEMEAGVDDGLTPPDVTRKLLGEVEESFPGAIWLWAPGVGSRHGLSEDTTAFSVEHIAAQRELAAQITGRDIGIALHGSSGLDKQTLIDAVAAGVVKVNWSSESLLIRSQAAQAYFKEHADELEPRHPNWKNTVMDNGLQDEIGKRYIPRVQERIEVLGGAGQASSSLVYTLSQLVNVD